VINVPSVDTNQFVGGPYDRVVLDEAMERHYQPSFSAAVFPDNSQVLRLVRCE
jgi:hypothetical protein